MSDNIKYDSEIKSYLKERYNIANVKHLNFFVEYVKTGNASQSYMKTNPKTVTLRSAYSLSSKLLSDYKVSLIDMLDLTGHGEARIAEALDMLFAKDPDKYLNHVEKLRKLDTQRLDVNIRELPTLEITSEEDK